jgi:hypothetical protein
MSATVRVRTAVASAAILAALAGCSAGPTAATPLPSPSAQAAPAPGPIPIAAVRLTARTRPSTPTDRPAVTDIKLLIDELVARAIVEQWIEWKSWNPSRHLLIPR